MCKKVLTGNNIQNKNRELENYSLYTLFNLNYYHKNIINDWIIF